MKAQFPERNTDLCLCSAVRLHPCLCRASLSYFFYVPPVNNIKHSQKGLMTYPVFPGGEMMKLAARILTEAPNIPLALLNALIYHFPIFRAACFQTVLLQSVRVLGHWLKVIKMRLKNSS